MFWDNPIVHKQGKHLLIQNKARPLININNIESINLNLWREAKRWFKVNHPGGIQMKIFLVKFGISRIKEWMNVHVEMLASLTVQDLIVYDPQTHRAHLISLLH